MGWIFLTDAEMGALKEAFNAEARRDWAHFGRYVDDANIAGQILDRLDASSIHVDLCLPILAIVRAEKRFSFPEIGEEGEDHA